MRINKFVASATGLSRRAADVAIAKGEVTINGQLATTGQTVQANDTVHLRGQVLHLPTKQLILLHKPAGYVVSRNGQGSKTIYDLLSPTQHHLKPIGRLDKESSGLLLLTNDGELSQGLTHPSQQKSKVYEIRLDKELRHEDQEAIAHHGIELEDGLSKFSVEPNGTSARDWRVTMHQGRNRQIRRTFAALGYHVQKLHRTTFGPYALGDLAPGQQRQFVVK
jgi:23S rRNA pseudouridine2605 synthase